VILTQKYICGKFLGPYKHRKVLVVFLKSAPHRPGVKCGGADVATGKMRRKLTQN